jgi:hypothetical protein
MTKKFVYRLALLGCVSTCLMSAAYAKSEVKFVGEEPTFRDLLCNGEPRYVKYVIKNVGDDDVVIDGFTIQSEQGTTHGLEGLVSIKPKQDRDDCGKSGSHRFPFELEGAPHERGESCEIWLAIDPEQEDIQTLCRGHLIEPGFTYNGELSIDAENWQDPIETDFEILFTTEGSVADFSLIGDNICNEESQCSDEYMLMSHRSEILSLATVMQPVAVTGECHWEDSGCHHDGGFFSDDIDVILEDSDDKTVYNDDYVSEVAESDLSTTLANIYNLPCTQMIDNNLSGQTLTPPPGTPEKVNVFCFKDADDTAWLDNSAPLTFKGNGIYIIKVNPDIDGADDDYIMLQMLAGAKMVLQNGAKSGDIYFAVYNGSVESEKNTTLVGSYLIDGGDFEVDPDHTMNSSLEGRIAVLDNNITLRGTNITPTQDEDEGLVK